MKKLYIFTLTIIILLAVGCTSSANKTSKCYQVIDDPDKTIISINENDSPQPSITIMNADGSDPLSTYGRIEPGVFIYGDGSKMNYNDQKAWGSEGELIEGIEANAFSCPK